MQLSLAFLSRKLENRHHVTLLEGADKVRLSEVRPYCDDGAPCGDDVLYVVEGEAFGRFEGAPPRAIVWVGRSDPPADVPCIWVKDAADAADVLRELCDEFSRFRAWRSEISDMLLDCSAIKDVVMKLADVTDNPFYFCDVDFRIIAISDDRGLGSFSETWSYQQKFGRYPVEVVADMLLSGDFKTLSKNRPAWLFDNPKSFDLPFVVKAVFHGPNVYGYLFTIPWNDRRCECDIELLETMGDLMSRFIAHRISYQPTTGFPKETVLRDHLLGKEVDHKELLDALMLLGWREDGRYAVTDFHLPSDDCHGTMASARVQAGMVEANMRGKAIIHSEGLALVQNAAEVDARQSMARVEAVCARFGWKAGASNEFDGFAALPTHFKQARFALELGEARHPERVVHRYKDYTLDAICSFLDEGADRALFTHCDLEALIAYDGETESNLVETLLTYLENDCSIVATAKALSLHRNSVIYRVKKIKSMMTTDLDDFDNRLVLSLSLAFWHRRREGAVSD